jgi:hypothetical protein
MVSVSKDEEKLTALIITCMRYGIEKDSLIDYIRETVPERIIRNRAFVRALQINDQLEANCGKGVLAVGVIVEYVRQYFGNLDAPQIEVAPSPIRMATVIRLYRMGSPTETSLTRLGEQVVVVEEDESALWAFVEKPDTDEAGWVPRDTLSYNEQT